MQKPKIYSVIARSFPNESESTLYFNPGNDHVIRAKSVSLIRGKKPFCPEDHKCCKKPVPVKAELDLMGGPNIGSILPSSDYLLLTKKLGDSLKAAGVEGIEYVPAEVIHDQTFLDYPEYCLPYPTRPFVVDVAFMKMKSNLCPHCNIGIFYCKTCWGGSPMCNNCGLQCYVSSEGKSKTINNVQLPIRDSSGPRVTMINLKHWHDEDLFGYGMSTFITEKFAKVLIEEKAFPCMINELEYELLAEDYE